MITEKKQRKKKKEKKKIIKCFEFERGRKSLSKGKASGNASFERNFDFSPKGVYEFLKTSMRMKGFLNFKFLT